IDLTMARGAANALSNVNAVIEIHVVRQIVNANPADGCVGAKTLAHRFEHRRTVPYLRMAVHARFRGRDVGERRIFNRSMAVAAVNTQAPHVMLVAERYGLIDGDLRARG